MKNNRKRLVPLALALLMCTTSAVPAFAANKEYSFSLKTTKSVKGSGATKDDDERTAYLKVTKMSENVTTNFRVRAENGAESTYVQTVSKPSSLVYYLDYKPGKREAGQKYYLWANLDQAQTSEVTISGTWCP
ncbi:hypothetical protein [Anaerotignum sp.]